MSESEELELQDVWDQTHHYLPHDHAHPQSGSAQTHHLSLQREEGWDQRRVPELEQGEWWVGFQEVKWE